MTLAKNLPYGAQTWIDAGADAAWTAEAHLTAMVVDLLNGANWQRGGGKGRQPKPIDRPEDIHKTKKRRDSAIEKAERFRARQRAPRAPSPTGPKPTDRPRDSRGRFVSRRG